MPFPARLADCSVLEDLPNVGPRIARDLRRLGIRAPHDLRGCDPYALYDELNRRTRTRHDPCVLDTFIAAVHFANGAAARPWWTFTAERKRRLAGGSASVRRRDASTQASRSPASAQPGAIAVLRNLGPASAQLLQEAGIASVARLRRLGAVAAWQRVRARHPRASLNLLWALEGALTDRDWQEVARTERTRLLLALDAGR
jgi:hypothetical protein